MSGIEVLGPDAIGAENVQRWAASGLPVPPSWRVSRETVLALQVDDLARRLRALPRMFGRQRRWVLHHGVMNPRSRRESLLKLDSDQALARALHQLFEHRPGPDHAIIQALPDLQAAGVLFTRHPLRQDLPHMVVEGVPAGAGGRQRLVFDTDGRLVHHGDGSPALDRIVPAEALVTLGHLLRNQFDHPQAGEWVYDGERIWLLQSLPVGSLPVPEEAWNRRAGGALFNQALTPLWYTLEGRWLKTAFWWPLARRHGWKELENVEPYRRQHSHLYSNGLYFRRLAETWPAAWLQVPPAWQPPESLDDLTTRRRPSPPRRRWLWTLAVLERRLKQLHLKQERVVNSDRDALWHQLIALDRIGERLARLEGRLCYLWLPELPESHDQPFPLTSLLTASELRALDQALNLGKRDVKDAGQGAVLATLRPGDDPVHAPVQDSPSLQAVLEAVGERRRRHDPGDRLDPAVAAWLSLAKRARALRQALAQQLREWLVHAAGELVSQELLAHPDDIHFLYFDELWTLWMQRRIPKSAAGRIIAQRKVRYLEDALVGAPDWKMDRIGYGFGGNTAEPLLLGLPLVAGRVEGPVRRLCSAWALNNIQPGDVLVVDEVDAAWTPWLARAGALILSRRDPANPAASLARACGIPAVWGLADALHGVRDEEWVTLDGAAGTVARNTSPVPGG
ncbi:hypothetical protein MA04_02520 [Alcanivorax balearicus MACL04]|uniref:PEP-utilising enzyme mobile domain-containing protein n=1 Tax=Alloalcanivorax balearicus MACL04 TaxID=1177182 RepID=A0ABT2R0B7_9GAMM|nr:PEP-utilizing enzyme [Alloalcanivorax balearicus]MCU5783220.1 hypothetical protein [Alloalcanivorax balearicus MACL04]